jgi:hypothetical protein
MAALRARFEEARKDGDLPPNSDIQELARYILVIGWGMALAHNQARRDRNYSRFRWHSKRFRQVPAVADRDRRPSTAAYTAPGV